MVLEWSYELPKAEILRVLRALEGAREIGFRSNADASRAISAYESGTGGFADYLIGETSRAAGASVVYTFDGGLAAGLGFAMP